MALETLQEKGLELVVDTDDLESSEEVAAITTRAAQELMNNGYIPRAIVDKVNFWLYEYRTTKAREQVDAPG